MIVIDTNAAENFVYTHCLTRTIPVQRQRLDVGDIELCFENTKIVFERKTWADLAASICDGRWTEQKSRMSEDENVTIKYAYIIEGELPGWEPAPNSHMNPICLWGALLKTQLRDNMDVFYTKNQASTSALVEYTYKQMISGGFDVKQSKTITGINTKRKRDNLNSPESIYIAMLAVIPGMSKQKAECIYSAFPSIKALTEVHEKEIATLKCGTRNIGPVLAQVICSTFQSK